LIADSGAGRYSIDILGKNLSGPTMVISCFPGRNGWRHLYAYPCRGSARHSGGKVGKRGFPDRSSFSQGPQELVYSSNQDATGRILGGRCEPWLDGAHPTRATHSKTRLKIGADGRS